MSEMTYDVLLDTALGLYIKGDYKGGYDLMTENSEKYKENESQIYNFRYCFASKAGLYELAIQVMREAIMEKGYWYSYTYLLEEDDIKPLKEYDEFSELAGICKDREAEAVKEAKPQLKIIKPHNVTENKKNPLLIALHGNGQNLLRAEANWSSCTTKDYILALLQSSQTAFAGAYHWNDFTKGSEELKEQFEKTVEEYDIASDNVIIGGFSAGARVSLYSMLNDIIMVKGYIFVGPWLPEIDQWEPLMDTLKEKGIKGYIICGDKDKDCIENTEKFVSMLNQREVPNVYRVIKELSHRFPQDFNMYLKEAIEFING